jgi:Slime mold cyclic AMP receptor
VSSTLPACASWSCARGWNHRENLLFSRMLHSLPLSRYHSSTIDQLNVDTLFPSAIPAYTAMDALGFISFILGLLTISSQRLFPQKSNGNMQKTSMSICVLFLSARTIFTLFQPVQRTLCTSPIESATSDTNWRCAFQGFLVVFGAYGAVLWCSVRSYEVFAVVVFGTKMRTGMWLLMWNTICWGVPLVVAIAAVATGSINFIATYFCGPRFDLQKGLIAYPLIVWVPLCGFGLTRGGTYNTCSDC